MSGREVVQDALRAAQGASYFRYLGYVPVVRRGLRAGDVATFLSSAEQSGGKFLYAVRVLNDVESGALPADRLKDLPPEMDAFYLDAFERRFPDGEDYAPVRPLLGVLCAKREPISRAELARH